VQTSKRLKQWWVARLFNITRDERDSCEDYNFKRRHNALQKAMHYVGDSAVGMGAPPYLDWAGRVVLSIRAV
jgi:hypothetical protein